MPVTRDELASRKRDVAASREVLTAPSPKYTYAGQEKSTLSGVSADFGLTKRGLEEC